MLIGFYNVLPHCAECGLGFHDSLDGTWAFMYISTAFLTGLVILAMLLMTPPEMTLGRAVLLPTVLVLILGTLPRRKCVALAIEFLVQAHLGPTTDEEA